MASKQSEPVNVLYRIKRGLAGYVSYLAACEMNESFSEYVLYEPILRILTARRYDVECEVACPGIQHSATGDKRRLDFVAKGPTCSFALEVKWAASRRIDVDKDYLKLAAYRAAQAGNTNRAFLCVFGKKSDIMSIELRSSGTFAERGNPVVAEFGVTRFGCRIFEVSPNKALQPTSRAQEKGNARGRGRAARG